MRILYIHQYFNTPAVPGSTRSYEMARRLVASGHKVTMITSSANLGEAWAPDAGWYTHELDGIQIEVMHVPYNNNMAFAERIKAFFRFAWGASWHINKFDADVVFATSTPLTIAVPGLVAKFRKRIPLVFEVRDLWPELPIAVGALRNPLARLAAKALEWIAYHASAHVVALSPGIAGGVLRRGVGESAVTVIPNSCDVDLFDVPVETGNCIRQQLQLEPEQPLLVYTGTFGRINGVGYLVEAAVTLREIAPQVRILLVGSGAEFEEVNQLARELGVLNENLWIWSSIPKAQVPKLLAAATLTTSVFIPIEPMWNNSANKFFDSLAAGKPVAINYEGWQAELLRMNGAGVVLPPNDPHAAAFILADFIQDRKGLRKASEEARRLAYEEFSRDKLYAKLERVLHNVVQQ